MQERKIKRSSKIIDIVSHALKLSVNGVCSSFQVINKTHSSFSTGLTVTSCGHQKFVTGKNVILHKALTGAGQNITIKKVI